MYWPSEPGGEPTFDADRAPQWFDFNDETIESLRSVGAEDVRETIRQIDIYHRELGELMSIGYPEARAPDLDAVAEKHIPTNPITELFLPALSRVHTLRARSEASRRATQLAYATHLFKHRNGRWPESLGELDADFGPEMLTDPFTGDHFGYQLTKEGPRIYSLSENARDDGGVHSRRWEDKVENDADSDDYVFWPPQHR